ncbi:MAG: amino acid permease [Phycisphaerae bacterium]|nr:amino acid permease [Phycisphaerae bacterium]
MGLGMMIGAGVFIGIGIATGKAGPGGVILTFALNGLIALFTAMSFAELASAIPRAGGVYNFARIAFGRGVSFLGGWMEWFASSVAGSLYAVVFAAYTTQYVANGILELGLVDAELTRVIKVVAVAVGLGFLYINYRGASETGKIGALFTLAQMGFVLSIAVVGIVRAGVEPSRLSNFQPFLPNGWSVLLVTMGFIYVAFEGFEVIAQAGDETIEPKKNMPKAMLYSVLIVTVTYVLVSFATIVAVRPDDVGGAVWRWIGTRGPASDGETGFGDAVNRMIPYGGLLVTLAVIFSSTSALNATIYSATRAGYALGRDRMLPGALARISPKRRTPYVALTCTGVIVLTVAALLPTKHVASCASIMFLFLFFLVNLCAIKVRLNMGDELQYGFVMPLFPVFPIAAIVGQAVLAANIGHISRLAIVVAPAWVLAGVGVYLLYARKRAVATEDEIQVLAETEGPPGGEYRVMVAVANPANALSMVRQTYRLCEATGARVELLHMVPVPPQVPLSDADKYMTEGREGILESMLYLAPLFAISTHLRYCRNPARGIVSAVRERRTNLLIMGWHGRAMQRTFRIGATVDPVIERAPCNVVVMKDCGGDRVFRRVLVPVAGGPNAAYALEVAGILADAEAGEVTAFYVDRGGRLRRRGGQFDVDGFLDAQRERIRLPAERVRAKTAAGSSVVRAILAEARDYDLVVLGCTEQPLLRQIAHDPIPERVAQRCDRPLVMAKASGGLRSWVRRWV